MITKVWLGRLIRSGLTISTLMGIGLSLPRALAGEVVYRAVNANVADVRNPTVSQTGTNNHYLPLVRMNYDVSKGVIAALVSDAAPEITDFRLVKLDTAAMLSALGQGESITLPFVSEAEPGGVQSPPNRRDVSLTSHNILDGNFSAFLTQNGNNVIEIELPQLRTYRGIEVGNDESAVILSILPGEGWASGFVLTADGWSLFEPIEPLLTRAGIDPAPFEGALNHYDHLVYNIADVSVDPPHNVGEEGELLPLQAQAPLPPDDNLRPQTGEKSVDFSQPLIERTRPEPAGNQSPDTSTTTTIVTFSLWADYEFSADEAGVTGGVPLTSGDLFASWFRIMLTMAGVQEGLHLVDPNLNLQVLNIRFEDSPTAQCLSATSRSGMLSQSISCPHGELDSADLVHVFSGKIGGGLAYIRGLLGPPNCTTRFPAFICNQQNNSGEHVNHGVEGHSGSLAGQILLASHEMGHNFGAVHGEGNSKWGFADDVFLAGDFVVGSGTGYDDVLCGHNVGGSVTFWACQNIPRGYYDPMIGDYVTIGTLRHLRPPYLASLLNAGEPGDIYLSGDYNNDNLLDMAIGHPAAGMVQWSVALHRTDNNYKLAAPVQWHVGLGSPGDLFFSGDFDGDGSDDLGFAGVNGLNVSWTVARSTGSGFSLASPGGVWSTNLGDPADTILVGDFTGDGRIDVAIGHDTGLSSVSWRVAVSAGSKFETKPPYPIWNDSAGEPGDLFYTGDFDGDEKSDLGIAHPVSLGQVAWWIGLSKGVAFLGPNLWANDIGAQGDRFLIMDLNFDGKSDVVFGHPASSTPGGPYAWYGHESDGNSFNTWFHVLSKDVCIWSTPPDCGTGIMLYGYGYGYGGRLVNAFSWANTSRITAVRDVLNTYSP